MLDKPNVGSASDKKWQKSAFSPATCQQKQADKIIRIYFQRNVLTSVSTLFEPRELFLGEGEGRRAGEFFEPCGRIKSEQKIGSRRNKKKRRGDITSLGIHRSTIWNRSSGTPGSRERTNGNQHSATTSPVGLVNEPFSATPVVFSCSFYLLFHTRIPRQTQLKGIASSCSFCWCPLPVLTSVFFGCRYFANDVDAHD